MAGNVTHTTHGKADYPSLSIPTAPVHGFISAVSSRVQFRTQRPPWLRVCPNLHNACHKLRQTSVIVWWINNRVECNHRFTAGDLMDTLHTWRMHGEQHTSLSRSPSSHLPTSLWHSDTASCRCFLSPLPAPPRLPQLSPNSQKPHSRRTAPHTTSNWPQPTNNHLPPLEP